MRWQDAEGKLGIDASLIVCFLKHLGAEKAFETLKQAWLLNFNGMLHEPRNSPASCCSYTAGVRKMLSGLTRLVAGCIVN